MIRKLLTCLIALALLLGGCAQGGEQYSVTYLELFDTVTTITGSAHSRQAFDKLAEPIHARLKGYHRLFDIYKEYPNLNNLKTVNDMAGVAPVTVGPAIIALLKDCVAYYDMTGGKVNVAMGAVLSLWHEARENGTLPDATALRSAAEHGNIQDIIIDEAASTVYLADPLMSLDVGAVAKGWAAEQVAKTAPAGLLINLGGNVRATGEKSGGRPWTVGVQNPHGEGYLCKTELKTGSIVTSGDYQRTYQVEGKSYHHVIDPETLYPSEYWSSVTIYCADSAMADALSTALFLLPREEGQALLNQCQAQALWVDKDGNTFQSPDFPME